MTNLLAKWSGLLANLRPGFGRLFRLASLRREEQLVRAIRNGVV